MRLIFCFLIIVLGCNYSPQEKSHLQVSDSVNRSHANLLNYAVRFTPKSPKFNEYEDFILDSLINALDKNFVLKYSDSHIAILLLLEKQYYFQLSNSKKYKYEGTNLMDIKGDSGPAKVVELFCKIIDFESLDNYLAIDVVFSSVEVDEYLRQNLYLKEIHQKIKSKKNEIDKSN